jgi:hypothetical protein
MKAYLLEIIFFLPSFFAFVQVSFGSVTGHRWGKAENGPKCDRSPSGFDLRLSKKNTFTNCLGASGHQGNTLPTKFHITLAQPEVAWEGMRDLRGCARSGEYRPRSAHPQQAMKKR